MSAVLDALVTINSRVTDMTGQVYAAFHYDYRLGPVDVRRNVKDALKSAREIVGALEAAERSLDDAAPSSVVDFNKAPESFQQVGEPASKVVRRLVPRSAPGGDAA